MNKTSIEWTTFTANPLKYRRKSDGKVVWACVKTSPGCAGCYSEAIAIRFDRGKIFNAQNMEELEPFLDEKELHHMRTAKMISGIPVSGSRCFVADMTDLFGAWVPDDLLDRLFSTVLEARSDVQWQLLTKRADRLHRYLSWRWGEGRLPSRNIALGVSVEDQKRADERIPILNNTPAVVRFLSCEPLLGPIAFEPDIHNLFGRIHWCIVGGESGPRARPCHLSWIRSIVGQCREALVEVFVKQLGGRPLFESYEATLYLRDKKGGNIDEFPDDLKVRQFPGQYKGRA